MDPKEQTSVKFKSKSFHSRKCTWKYRLQNGGYVPVKFQSDTTI